jgi:hypothetical protein
MHIVFDIKIVFIQHAADEASDNYINVHGARGNNDGADFTYAETHLEGKLIIDKLDFVPDLPKNFEPYHTVSIIDL